MLQFLEREDAGFLVERRREMAKMSPPRNKKTSASDPIPGSYVGSREPKDLWAVKEPKGWMPPPVAATKPQDSPPRDDFLKRLDQVCSGASARTEPGVADGPPSCKAGSPPHRAHAMSPEAERRVQLRETDLKDVVIAAQLFGSDPKAEPKASTALTLDHKSVSWLTAQGFVDILRFSGLPGSEGYEELFTGNTHTQSQQLQHIEALRRKAAS